jgi:hypothetical protein
MDGLDPAISLMHLGAADVTADTDARIIFGCGCPVSLAQ